MVGLIRELGSRRAAADILGLIEAVLLDFLLGNSDAHGKNYALLYEASAGVRLAPLYDLVSTQVYEGSEPTMAMTIGGVDDPEQVEMTAWRRLGQECGIGALPMLIGERIERILKRAEALVVTAKTEEWHRRSSIASSR